MKLLVDIGNTRLKWAWWDGARLQPGTSVAHVDADLERAFDDLWAAAQAPSAVHVADVVRGAAADALQAWTERRWGIVPRFAVSAAEAHGVRSAYPRPERLGVDRWCALVAARAEHPGALCVVDCGSALTLDAIDAGGRHLGGLIVPGLRTQHQALTAGRIRLDAPGEFPAGELPWLASDTREAVDHGVARCLVAFVNDAAGRLREEFGEGMVRLISGGDAPFLLRWLDGEWAHRPELVLRGLALLADEADQPEAAGGRGGLGG